MQEADTAPGAYYVTVIRDGSTAAKDTRFLLGPFVNDHAKALSLVSKAQAKADELDPRAHWYAYGTARYDGDDPPDGILNRYFPELFAVPA